MTGPGLVEFHQEAGRALHTGSPRLRVLLVHSQPELREVLTELLEGLNYEVIPVADAAEARQVRAQPDVVLLDGELPDPGRMLRRLLNRDGWGDIPAIALGGEPVEGFRHCLPKPLCLPELDALLRLEARGMQPLAA